VSLHSIGCKNNAHHLYQKLYTFPPVSSESKNERCIGNASRFVTLTRQIKKISTCACLKLGGMEGKKAVYKNKIWSNRTILAEHRYKYVVTYYIKKVSTLKWLKLADMYQPKEVTTKIEPHLPEKEPNCNTVS
jgi:hypothetical protein